MTMAESIIPQNILENRIEAQRSRIARAGGILGLAVRAARDLQEDACDEGTIDDLHHALTVAREMLDDIYDGLEPGVTRLFKTEVEAAHG
jgi:hypothetical protein